MAPGTKMMVDTVEFTRYVKEHTLLHVHYVIDCVLERYRTHRCSYTYARELRRIPEVSPYVVQQYIDMLRKQG